MYRETISKVGKMKTPFVVVCDRGSSSEYFDTFPSLLGAKLIKIEQLEITDEKSNFGEKHDQSWENSAKMYCTYYGNRGCMVCIEKSNKICIVWE